MCSIIVEVPNVYDVLYKSLEARWLGDDACKGGILGMSCVLLVR